MRNRYATRRAVEAIVYGDGTRHCNWCGDYIDPIDWCGDCKHGGKPCATTGGPHRRLRKRADAAFCDSECRSSYHNDTGPQITSRRYR
ncbi:MAG: hypothetical protein HOW97_33980 [Catenulispora sp.]|nr:hypothetical protein [Catenulispora sp.]